MLARIIFVYLFLTGCVVHNNINPMQHLIAVQQGETSASQLVRVSDGEILDIPAVENLPIIFEPKWSSDYRYIAFLMGSEGRLFYNMSTSDVFLLEYETGTVTRLTDDALHTLKHGILWGPDNKSLIILSEKGIEIIDLERRERTPLFENQSTIDQHTHISVYYSLGGMFTGKLIQNRFMSYIRHECRSFDDCTNTVNIYDFALMNISHQIPVEHVLNAVISPDMEMAVVLGIEDIRIYRVQDYQLIYSTPTYMNMCAFSSEKTLYCLGNENVYRIDLESKTLSNQSLINTVRGFGLGTTSDLVFGLFIEGNVDLYTYNPTINIFTKVLDDILFGEEDFGVIIFGRIADW